MKIDIEGSERSGADSDPITTALAAGGLSPLDLPSEEVLGFTR